jgi:hypothetical protein
MTDGRNPRRPPGSRPPRRRHPAHGARIVAAGASAAAVLGITAALGVAQHATAAPAQVPASSGPAAVSTVRPPTVLPARPAPFVPASAPDATTHGSR